LHKQHLLTQRGYTFYAVDALAVRDHSQACEEFGNYAVHEDLPRLIPKGEVWITKRLVEREGVYFIANALTQGELPRLTRPEYFAEVVRRRLATRQKA
jgi:hypothetical protein